MPLRDQAEAEHSDYGLRPNPFMRSPGSPSSPALSTSRGRPPMAAPQKTSIELGCGCGPLAVTWAGILSFVEVRRAANVENS